MQALYLVQTNITCIVLLVIIVLQMRRGSVSDSSSNRLFNYMVTALIMMCVTDTVYEFIDGQTFACARIMIEVFNGLYYEMITLISFLWCLYVMVKMNMMENLRSRTTGIAAIPFILMTALILVNYHTHHLFYVDVNNMYQRGEYTYLHWILSGGYLLVTTIILFRRLCAEKNFYMRREDRLLLSFIIAPTIASLVQMLVPGTSFAQVGMVISVLIIYLTKQNDQIMRDDLTGLNNKRAYRYYIHDKLYKDGCIEPITVIMMDVDNFKSINDTYGHIVGDRALRFVADSLKKACGYASHSLFLCRYAGDEFVISATGAGEDDIIRLIEDINSKLGCYTSLELPEAIDLSIGYATAVCRNDSDVDALINEADSFMYAHKRERKIADNPRR